MLLSAKRDSAPTLNSTVSDNQKEDLPPDYCSTFYSNNYHHLIHSHQYNNTHRQDKINKRQAKMLLERLNKLRIVQSGLTQKFDMCISKLQHELETKQVQNEVVRSEIDGIKKEITETRKDMLLIKQYLVKQEGKRNRVKREFQNEEWKDRKSNRQYRTQRKCKKGDF